MIQMGRPKGRKAPVPQIAGWHTEEMEARIQGVGAATVRRRARLGLGPKPTKFGLYNFYPDGASEHFLAEQRRRQAQEPRRPGRPVQYADATLAPAPALAAAE